MKPDDRWGGIGITEEKLNHCAEWISRDPGFRGAVIMYFRAAASLMRSSWYDYTLIPVVFFQSVAGLEGVLRLEAGEKERSFSTLLGLAVESGLVGDSDLTQTEALPENFAKLVGKGHLSYAHRLAALIPKLRNQYLHGDYLLHPRFLPLSINVREIVDAIVAHGNRTRILDR